MVQDPHVGPELGSNDPDLDSSIVGNTIPKRKMHMPSKETLAKYGGIAGKVVFTGVKGALTVARVGTNLASKGINAISKTEIFQESVSSILTIGSTLAIMPVAGAIGIVNKALLGKESNFVENVRSWNRGVRTLTTPLVSDALVPLLGITTNVIDKATEKSIAQRISETIGYEISLEDIIGLLHSQQKESNPDDKVINFNDYLNPNRNVDPLAL